MFLPEDIRATSFAIWKLIEQSTTFETIPPHSRTCRIIVESSKTLSYVVEYSETLSTIRSLFCMGFIRYQ